MAILFSVLKVITTIFLLIAAIYFSYALWKSKTNADLVGNGIYTVSMVLAVVFMWIER